MKKDILKFTPEQWQLLAFMHIAAAPVHIDSAATIIPIKPGPLINLINQGMQSGYIFQMQENKYSLSKELTNELDLGIKKIVTRKFLISILESIEERHLEEQLPRESMAAVLEGAGRMYEAAYAYHEIASKDFLAGKAGSALKYEISAINILKGEKASRDRDKLFVSAVLGLSEIYIGISQAHSEIITLLKVAKKIAARMGDRRSSLLIDFHLGRYYFMANKLSGTLDALHKAIEELNEFSDADIRDRTEQFVGLYYYLQGMYGKAAVHLEKTLHSRSNFFMGQTDYILLLYYAFSCACTGQFHKAIGVLDANWRRAFKRSEYEQAFHTRAVLGYILLMSGRTDESLEHLNASKEYAWKDSNAFGKLITEAGFAFEAFRSGRIKESYNILKDFLSGGFYVRQYPVSAFLEMLSEYNRRKYPPVVSGYVFDEESNRIIKGPNIHLKGAALRIMAHDAITASPKSPLIPRYLAESEKLLLESGDPVELARTYVEFSRYLLNRGEKEKASEYAMKAWENFSGLGDLYCPADIKHLLTDDTKEGLILRERGNLTARLMKMVGGIIPSHDTQNLFDQILEAVAGFLKAEKAALLFFDKKKGNAPLVKASRSIAEEEIYAGSFRNSLSLIFTARKEKKLVIRTFKDEDGTAHNTMCLPVDAGPDFDSVMFFESVYNDSELTKLEQAVPDLIMNMAKDAFAKILRFESIRQEMDLPPARDMHQQDIGSNDEIISKNSLMTGLLSRIDKAAVTDASILVTGETGVGKELVARRIHAKSKRAKGPFVTVNIAGIPETLIESELFGHEKGAFTGAAAQRKGRIELAHNGTLFIDEFGDIPFSIQVKLLRVLQDKTFSRLGGARNILSDFRLVTATNKDLESEVESGRFRRDLFYRVNTIQVHVPPLRERKTDIVLIARNFLKRFIKEFGKPELKFTPEQEQSLMDYAWPGNVRELRNVIERSILVSAGSSMELSLPDHKEPGQDNICSDIPTLDELERRYIRHIIKMTGGKISGKSGACLILGMKRTTLNGRMKKLGIAHRQ